MNPASISFGTGFSAAAHRLWEDVERIRAEAPLIHNITNYVVMNLTANALLALGASPVMAHAVEEVEEMAGLARALVINIGTLSVPWIEAMLRAGQVARRRGIPIILDPVGSGATAMRTATALRLIREIAPTVIRGNASEIRSLVRAGDVTKGVDTRHAPEEILEEARALSRTSGAVVTVSGPTDLIVKEDILIRVQNGHSMMPRITGLGCTASALLGAFLAVSRTPVDAATHAMALTGVAGEMAAEDSQGPGSFVPRFLDVLYLMTEGTLHERLRMVSG